MPPGRGANPTKEGKMDSETKLGKLVEQSRADTRALESAAAIMAGGTLVRNPTEAELDAGEAAVRAYRKGKTKPRIREEVRQALIAAEVARR
jgi:hypothetical protein